MEEEYGRQGRTSVSVPEFMKDGQNRRRTYIERETTGGNGYRESRRTPEPEEEKEAQEQSAAARQVNAARPAKRKKKKRAAGKIAFIFAILLSVLAGHMIARLSFQFTDILNGMNRDNVVDLNDVDVNGSALAVDDNIVNILLVGADKRESWKEAGRSDSVMIATMDSKHKKLKLTSLMRDMYLPIPDHGEDRFNAAYSFGGVELLYKTIASNFGIRVDGYAVVDFAAFKEVIDTMGGVDIDLTDWEYNYLTTAYKKGSVLKLQPGHNRMNGAQALAYTRIRQDTKGDFGRTERQRKVLASIFKKVKTMSLGDIMKLAKKVTPEITTDLANDEIISYLTNIILMGTTKIEQLRIPLDNTYTQDRIDDKAILLPDFEANKKALHTFIYEEES